MGDEKPVKVTVNGTTFDVAALAQQKRQMTIGGILVDVWDVLHDGTIIDTLVQPLPGVEQV